MPIRLLIADVDGTLVNKQKEITVRTREAVEKMRAAGILFSVTSGRPPRGVATVAKALGLTTPIAAFNGGALVRPDLSVIEERKMPLPVVTEVVRYLQESGVNVWVYRGVNWFVTNLEAPRIEREKFNVGFESVLVKNLGPVLDGAVKIVGVSHDPVLLGGCEADVRRRVGEHVTAVRSQPYYLDITHADANKGTVARLNSRFLRIPLDEIAVIGDMLNDVPMFGVAGTSIAMGNSSPDVKRAARYVTTGNDDEGFANAVDWFILRESPPARPTLGLPAKVRACLFDLDAVLTQTAEGHAAAWEQTFDAYLRERSKVTGESFVPFDPVADYAKYVDGKMRVEAARSFLASRGIVPPEEVLEDLGKRKGTLLRERLRKGQVVTYDGSVRFLREVRKAGLRTAVVSSSEMCEEVLASTGLADLFDARIDGVFATKRRLAGQPAPDMLVAAAQELGVTPVEAAVFESSLSGLEAGRAGHFCYVVAVDRVGRGFELRAHGADAVVSDPAVLLEPI